MERLLRADIPPESADDAFIGALAQLAASSVSAAAAAPIRGKRMGVRVAAVAASVAMISAGAAFGVQHLGDNSPVPGRESNDPSQPTDSTVPADSGTGRGEHPHERRHDPSKGGAPVARHDGDASDEPAPQQEGVSGQGADNGQVPHEGVTATGGAHSGTGPGSPGNDTDPPDTDPPDTDQPDTDPPDTDQPDTDQPDSDQPESDIEPRVGDDPADVGGSGNDDNTEEVAGESSAAEGGS